LLSFRAFARVPSGRRAFAFSVHRPVAPGALTRRDAERILDAHGLGPLRALTPFTGGWINPVFLLNGEYVLRIRPAGKSGGAFLTEAALCARLRGKAPVPEILAVDTSREVLDADYMLARRLPGESLTRAWLRASPPVRERLASAFADLL